MPLPPSFRFSQSSLQDFVDCPRRFLLRHLRRQAWPAIQSEPVVENEIYLARGARFHRLVHQYLLGLSPERLAALAQEPELQDWWDNFLGWIASSDPLGRLVGARQGCFPELALSAPLDGFRLLARCDLVLVPAPGQAVIFDWKTSRSRPRSEWLASRLQTRIYRYLLVRAGAYLNGGEPFSPDGVQMVYWFAGQPGEPECLPYNSGAYAADEAYLKELVGMAHTLGEDEFALTPAIKRSEYCVYRSLCGRGVRAGVWEDESGEGDGEAGGLEFVLDFEQTGEIEF